MKLRKAVTKLPSAVTSALILGLITGFSFPLSAEAGLFDSIVNETKKAIETETKKILDDSDEQDSSPDKAQSKDSSATQNTASSEPTKKYDVIQLKAIQERLVQLGYYQGEPDGMLGNQTRVAIKQFEAAQNLAVTGEPSAGLLGQLNSVYRSTGANIKGANEEFPEITVASMTLAAVHFKPSLLDDDRILKDVLLDVHPEYGQDVSNEFKWRQNRDQYKKELLQRAESAQLVFQMLPWRTGSVAQSRRIQFSNYDFDKERFLAGPILTKMFLGGTAEPDSKYELSFNYFDVDQNMAQKVADHFDNKSRIFYPSYTIRATGIDTTKARPSPIVEFVGDQISLYVVVKGSFASHQQYASNHKADYQHFLDVKLPVH